MRPIALVQNPEASPIDTAGEPAPRTGRLRRLARGDVLPTSLYQERLWVLDRLASGRAPCNMATLWTTDGPTDTHRVCEAILTIVERHEILRATFEEGAGDSAPVIRLLPASAVPVSRHDLSPRPAGDQQRALRAAVDAELAHPFELGREPPVRFAVYGLGEGRVAVLLTVHHIAADPYAMRLLVRELRAACRGEPILRPALQYADYAAWQREASSADGLESQLRWWRDRLAGAPPSSIFPPDRIVAPGGVPTFGAHAFAWSTELSVGLRRLVRLEGASACQALMAACATVLSRHTGQHDIVVGSPVSLRGRPEFQAMPGPFANMLALRLDLSDNPPFRTLLARARDAMREAFAHGELPFEKLIEHLKPPVSLDHPPLLQMALVENDPSGDDAQPVDGVGALEEITWVLCDDARGDLRGRIEYRSDLHAPRSIERIAAQVQAVLEAAVRAPECRLSELPLLSPHEREQVIRAFNATTTDRDPACITRRFERQARRVPHAVAVRAGQDSLTYDALDKRASQLARHLRSMDVGQGSLVALCLPRSLDLMVALLGVLKAGAAYVPLDPAFPAERLAFMLGDSGARVLITAATETLRAAVPPAARHLDLREAAAALSGLHDGPLEIEPAPGDTAYLLYTSGSTGIPKGVAVAHASLSNLLDAMRREPGLGPDDILAAVTTISFDIAALELFLPLTVGARIELVPHAVSSDGPALAQLLADSGATVLQATPSTWRLLLEAGWRGRPRFRALCGGESLTPELAERLLACTRELWNLYGPTETTVWSTADRVVAASAPISIGRPIANTSVYVLDPYGQPVSIGMPGELWIGGAGVSMGYHQRPTLTAQCFVPDPFSDRADARMYRTGDLGRWLPDGRLEHLGRLDRQVKVRGFRIELGEVESLLGRHVDVRQAAVTARDDGAGEQELVAYVVYRGEPPPQHASLREFLRRSLPDYMVPTRIVSLPALPLTPNGKVDVNALPHPAAARDGAAAEPPTAEPRGPIEIQLLALWRHALGNDALGVHDDFFEHGGHSLKAVQLLSRIQGVFGRKLPLATLFQAPTVAAVAHLLEREHWVPSWRSLVAINPSGSALPMFWVPGVGGNVLMFGLLSRLLGPDQPMYGLQAQGLDGKEAPFYSLREMAAHYVDEVRSARPHGPYVICGACTGGVVAYEMAQQLLAQGAEVRLVVLDAWHPRSSRDEEGWGLAVPWPLLFVVRKFGSYVRTLARLPPRDWAAFLGHAARQAGRLHGMGVKSTLQDSNYYADKVVQATMKAVSSYVPAPYPAKLLNVMASERAVGDTAPDTRRCWEALSPCPVSLTVPSTDSGQLFVSPHVEMLAQILSQQLREPWEGPRRPVAGAPVSLDAGRARAAGVRPVNAAAPRSPLNRRNDGL